MDKQKRNLFLLIGLIVVAGGIGAWQFGLFGGGSSAAKKKDDKAAEKEAKAKEKDAKAKAKSTAKGKATAPAVPTGPVIPIDKDLPIPEKVPVTVNFYSWPVKAPSGGSGWKPDPDPEKGEAWPYDPFWVQNIEVVDPERKKYIDEVRQNWIPDGITDTWQWVREVDADGKTKMGPDGKPIERYELVREVWFKGKRWPYRVGDRLDGTRFVIEDIVLGDSFEADHPTKAFVRLKGDTGASLDLELAPAGRYTERQGAGPRRR